MKRFIYILLALLLPVFASAQGLELTDDTVYKDADGKTITLDKFQEYINSGDYSIDPKQDASGNVIAVGLIKLTDEDKIMASRLIEVKNEAEGFPVTPFNVTSIDGKNYSSAGQIGKVTVIKFWFKECAPCIQEMPKLNKLVEQYQGNEEVNFLAFGLDNKRDIQNFLRINPFKYDIIPSSEPTRASMNINGFPTHIVVNKEGVVSEYVQGGLLHIDSELENAIEIALGNRTPEVASGIQPAEINEQGEPVGFIIEPSMTIKNESGEEITFDDFMKLMETGDFVPHPAKTPSGKDYIIIKKKS